MNDILAASFILSIGMLAVTMWSRSVTTLERRFMALSYAFHVLATLAQIAITFGMLKEGGDLKTYMAEGTLLGKAIELDPNRFGPLWVDLILQREPDRALPVFGAGMTTGTMVALVGAVCILVRYSVYGANLLLATMACFGKFAIYKVFRELLPAELRLRMLIGILLLPSAVFWSSGLLKEAFVIAGIGPLWLGVHRILRGKLVRGVLLAMIGAVPITLLKPYTLFALSIAAAVWIGVDRIHAQQGRRGPVRIRPLYIIISVALAFAGVVALGRVFPIYSVENLGQDIARHQGLGAIQQGGSYYQMGDEQAMSLQKQIVFAPLALGTAFFRPFVFEANNMLAFIASLETLVIAILFGRMMLRPGPRLALRGIRSNPVLFASVTFALTFGLSVGLATTNFGSLSRYRMPLMPFYVTTVLILGSPTFQAAKTAAAKAKSAVALKLRRPARASGPPRASGAPRLGRQPAGRS